MMKRAFDIDAQLREHEVFWICAIYCPQPLFKKIRLCRKLKISWQKPPHLFSNDAASTNTVHDSEPNFPKRLSKSLSSISAANWQDLLAT